MAFKSLLAAGKGKLVAISVAAVALTAGAVYYFTSNSNGKHNNIEAAFKPYISGYTTGTLSKEAPIYITFASEVVSSEKLNTPVEEELFDFDPNINGTLTWTDKRTIRFTPKEGMVSGENYKASFKIGEVMQMQSDLKVFQFGFDVMEQNFEVVFEGLRFYENGGLRKEKLIGTLLTSDVAESEQVEKVLSSNQQGRNLNIRWHHSEDRMNHQFEIDSINRSEKPQKITIAWDGTGIGADKKGSEEYAIPALGDFSFVSAKAQQGEEQYVQIEFSDPLLKDQDLEGLVVLQGVPDCKLIIEQNIIRLYPPVRQIGTKTLILNEGIKNVDSKRLGKTQNIDILFEEIKPAVRLIGKGVILPSTDGLIFPFEAVSLKSVRVTITKIHENNITQFFQTNNFPGQNEIFRVGTRVVKKTISLNNTQQNDYARWKRYALNLEELIKTEPGAIYQVKLGFKRKDAFYTCTQEPEQEDNEEDEDERQSYGGEEYGDYEEDYYYSEDFNYEERDNACHNSYYGDRRSVTRNILASDLGIIAKKGSSGEIMVVVTDLKTTNPVSDASVEIYDFQQQLLATLKTGSDGIGKLDGIQKPYFAIIKKDNQKGYLRLDDGTSLSVSGFDVSGTTVTQGIKGFLFGERGVWRPGDSLFLTFVLENKLKTLPENQPVIFELVNPMGQVTKKMVTATSTHGFYNFSTVTADNDPTGNWLAKVKVGGATFTKPIKIETIKPNRLKIKIDLGKDKITPIDEMVSGNLEVKWLHGAIAKNLKADVTMVLQKTNTKFEKYEDYEFDDPSRSFSSEEVELFKGKVNEQGKADIKYSMKTEATAPGSLNAHFKIKVFEEGGDFSTDQFSLPYYPYSSFVGMKVPKGEGFGNMLMSDTNHTIQFATLDPNGKPLSGRKLEVSVYKLDWRWWWDSYEESLSNVLTGNSYKQIQNHTVITSQGKASWRFRVNYPEWGRYFIRVVDKESNHSTGEVVYVDWPGWRSKSRENIDGAVAFLNFTTDKETYKVGEEVKLVIPGSSEGRALISVESGSKVLENHWLETKNGKNTFSFKATEQMAPNVFVNITLLQPHAQTANDLPIRLYGIMPVKVENPQTILKPVIQTAPEFRPEEPVQIQVSEATGKAMTYTLAIVDEGLLDLTRFKTPDPWNNFYAREALGVKSYDIYEHVIGALGQKIDRILSIGGDGEIGQKDKGKAKRFPPVVKFMGPFRLNRGEVARHTFKMPEYIGSVRVMVVAGDPEGAYGNAEKAVPVRKPLMLLATLPRVIGPDEFVALPVNVFAMTSAIKNVTVEVKTDNLLQLIDENRKEVAFTEPGDEVVTFYVKAKPTTGISKVVITATSGKERATYTINVGLRNPNAEATRVDERLLQAGETYTYEYTPFGVSGTNKGTLEVSSIPPLNLEKRLQYLIQFPYGCVEQTTSSVFPQLYVMDLINGDPGLAQRIEGNVKAGIARLKTFQLVDGSFGYWPGADEYSAWSTNYVGHFMLEAEKKGYTLPTGMKDSWKSFQKKIARNWSYSHQLSDLTQAYRLYTLALAGEAELGAMNRLKEQKNLTTAAIWRLAGAYFLAGQVDVANSLINTASTVIPDYLEMDNTFGTPIRDKAMILEVLAQAKLQPKGLPILKEISASLSSQRWMSTQETAFSLLAISKFVNTGIKASKVDFFYAKNDEKEIHAVTDMKVAQVNLKMDQTQPGKVTIRNTGGGTLYTRVITSGIPTTGNEQAAENNLLMTVNYLTKDGSPLNVTKIDQGTDFIAEVTISNPGLRGPLKNLALKQIFPSGWEIHNARMDNGVSAAASSVPTYQDIRDDRVYTYFDLATKEKKTFRIMLNASYLGKFYLPGVLAEAMYDGGVNALVPGKWVEVVSPDADNTSSVNP